MKKLIAMAVAILLTACIAAFASGTNPGATSTKKIDYQVAFHKIVLADDIDLQLVESAEKFIEIAGDNSAVEKVDWKISKNVLYIKSKKESLLHKVKITISVNQLKDIIIRGKSTVGTEGALLSPTLYVYIEDYDAHIHIKSRGQIRVVNDSGSELNVKEITGDVLVAK